MQTDFVDTPYGRIRFRHRSGSSRPVVFVHGLLVDGRLWDGTVSHLPDHHVVVPDWPLGSHRTALHADADLTPPGLARLVADTIASLGLDDVTLVANDTGGAIAQLVVTRHPERIGRLVLTNCDAFRNFLPPAFRPLQVMAHVPGLPWATTRLMRPSWARRLSFKPLSRTRIDPALLADWLEPSYRDPAVRRDLGKALKGISSRYTVQAATELKDFTRPAALVWGRKDPFFKPRYAQRLVECFPNGRLEWVDDAAAFVPIDQPARVAAAITTLDTEPAAA